MNSRTLLARVKDFEGLLTAEDTVPVKAVRKLYKMTTELVNLVAMTESRLADARAEVDKVINAVVEPIPGFDISPYTKQIKEMAEELVELKKELAELKKPKPIVKPMAPKAPSKPKTPSWKK